MGVHPDVNLSHKKLLAEPKLPNHSNIRPYFIKQLLVLHNQKQDLQLMLKEKRETIFSQRLLHFYTQGRIERNYPIRNMLPDVRIQVERSQWCYSYLQGIIRILGFSFLFLVSSIAFKITYIAFLKSSKVVSILCFPSFYSDKLRD